jgi:hypothetical protein
VNEEQEIFSGIIARTGEYSLKLKAGELYEAILAERAAPNEDERSFVESQVRGRQEKTLGPPTYVSPEDLPGARWGIIWPPEPFTETEMAHRDAMQPLIELRRQQMMGAPLREFHYEEGWTYDEFLWTVGPNVETNNMQPDRVPYYLCIVGSPERIPWEFQQYLDGEYAVGRLWFDDPEDCVKYVQHLLDYEGKPEIISTIRRSLFVGPVTDPLTSLSANLLVNPLYDWVTSNETRLRFDALVLLGDSIGGGAYKTELLSKFVKQDAQGQALSHPSSLFTASHGLEYDFDEIMQHEGIQRQILLQEQYEKQGALLFQEWPGGGVLSEHYLSGDQITDEFDFWGTAAFCFACYSAGTPLKQDWVHPTQGQPKQIAEKPFVARLPQKLLANGLIGFVGHVSPAWLYSFRGIALTSQQIATFKSVVDQMLLGQRIGHCTDYLNARWTALTVLLDQQVADQDKYDEQQLITTWLARNDCRGYVVLGDPAASIRSKTLQ